MGLSSESRERSHEKGNDREKSEGRKRAGNQRKQEEHRKPPSRFELALVLLGAELDGHPVECRGKLGAGGCTSAHYAT